MPIDAFLRRTPPRFYGDWVDTEESQRLLRYQTRGLNEQLDDMKKDFGVLVPIDPSRAPARDVVRDPQFCLPQGESAYRRGLTGRSRGT